MQLDNHGHYHCLWSNFLHVKFNFNQTARALGNRNIVGDLTLMIRTRLSTNHFTLLQLTNRLDIYYNKKILKIKTKPISVLPLVLQVHTSPSVLDDYHKLSPLSLIHLHFSPQYPASAEKVLAISLRKRKPDRSMCTSSCCIHPGLRWATVSLPVSYCGIYLCVSM